MKQTFLVSASLLVASASFAQSNGNSDNSLYKFDNAGTAKEVRRLGAAPEFPFLQHKTSSRQVYSAIKQHDNDNTRAMSKLNDLLMQIGYTNGAQDLQPGDISQAMVQPGTEGNMGSRGYTYSYTRLQGNPAEFKAWKIQPKDNSSAPLYLFAKCGNAFYPKNEKSTACISVPVNLKADMNQITLNNSGNTTTTRDENFVYYNRRHPRRHPMANPIAGVSDRNPSYPLMISSKKEMSVQPATYTVNLSAQDNTVSACPNATLDLTANINVEKTSAYTGNYPNSDSKTYTKVTRHEYKSIARHLRRVKRKEDKIARKTGETVEVATTKA